MSRSSKLLRRVRDFNIDVDSEADMVQQVVVHGCKYGFEGGDDHKQPIHIGIASRSIKIVEAMLAHGARADEETRYNFSALLYAALYGTPAMFQVLLQAVNKSSLKHYFDLVEPFACGTRSSLICLFSDTTDYKPRWYTDSVHEMEWRVQNLWTLLILMPDDLPALVQDVALVPELRTWLPSMCEFVDQHARWMREPKQAWIRAVLRI